MTRVIAATTTLAALLLGATEACAQAAEPERYAYRVPPQLDDGWDVAGLDEVGIDASTMGDLLAAIRDGRLTNLYSVPVVRDGKFAFEEYFEGSDERRGRSLGAAEFDHTTLHDLRSVTKSVTNTLIGIAVDRGLLATSDSVFSFFPEHADLATERKRAITVGHLLTMTSGLEWDESTYPYTRTRGTARRRWTGASSEAVPRRLVTGPARTPGEDLGRSGRRRSGGRRRRRASAPGAA